MKLHHLTQELSDVRAQKDQIIIEFEQRERVSQRRLIEESSSVKTILVDKEAMKSTVTPNCFVND